MSVVECDKFDTKVSILVNSCDKYEEAWEPYFTLFTKYWINCPYRVYLNSETKSYNKYFVNTITTTGNWGERLGKALDCIESEYIIFSLEDFFIQEPVDDREICSCVNEMDNNPNIGCIYFKNTSAYNEGKKYFDGKYVQMEPTKEYDLYVLNCQIGIWRKNVLRMVANSISDPWQMEVEGVKRNKEIVDKYIFLCSLNNTIDKITEEDTFPYMVERNTGYGIYASKWLWNNERMLKKNGIQINYSNLGKMSRVEYEWRYVVVPMVKKKVRKLSQKIPFEKQ